MTITTKQKIALVVGSSLLSAYLAIFIYQRIQRAKADAKVVSEDEALKILNEKSYTETPTFTNEDVMPKLLPEDTHYDTNSINTTDYDGLTDLQLFETQSGFGDF
jgi:hypothetical protein